ncbi:AvrE-family type 3 secretion system effector [Pseudomonas yamanorum]|uniref:AvrE-family type 3 secretion system effector n=1 Tax=Pseudomonas yamanorum TaxID=515393 RepID=UPI00210BBAB3|nr:AvrE-family type 3 secretion system effector [Pseudomonas yamanorum]
MLFTPTLKAGKVQADGTREGQEIARHLNQADKQYVADASGDAGKHTLGFKDERHYRFQIQSTPAAAAVFKSSRPQDRASIPPGNAPGRAHMAIISQVQTTVDGQQYRLEGGRLFRFDPAIATWVPDPDTRAFSRISLSREGQLLKMPKGVADSSAEGRVTVSLSDAQSGSVLHAAGATLSAQDEAGNPLQLTRIGLSGNTLYATTADGELLQADLQQARGGVLKMSRQPVESLERALKGAVSVEGFFHDDEGQLNMLVRDSRQQLHSAPLTGNDSLSPQWNLSDVLVKGIEKGLPQPSLQALASTVDLGQRGKIALDEGNLLVWDRATQSWESGPRTDIQVLERGLDGRAYVLQDGQLKAVATRQVRDPIHEGASHDLSGLPKPRTQVTLDEVLAGSGQQKITAFAVVDGRTFVTADQDNKLETNLGGVTRQLTLTPPIAVQALALDKDANLYAHSKDGGLFMLKREDWQGRSEAALSWSKVELPKGQRLDSLRMGADKHLVGEWDKRFFRLDTSADGAMTWGPVPSASASSAPGQSLTETLAGAQMRAQFPGGALSATSNVLGQTTEGVPLKRGFFAGVKAHFHPLDSLKEMGKGIQHHFTGRQGLESVYTENKHLHEQLKALSQARPVPGDIQSRLETLSQSGPREALAKAISEALAKVEKDSKSAAHRLGEAHGITFDPKPSLSRANIQPESTLHQLYEAFKRLSPSTQKETAALLANFEGQALSLPAWDPGRKRDLSHPSAMIEGDLIHQASTLKQLTDLTVELERVSGMSPSALERIKQSLESVMKDYEQSPVHKLSGQNIASYDQAETLYKNFKLLAKDLGTPGSALHWHLSRLLGLPADGSLKEAMTQEIQQMGSGQTLSPSRTKGKNLGAMVTGIKPVAPLEFFVGVSKSYSNGVSISRTDKGARVEISMDDTRRLAASVATGLTLGKGPTAVGHGLRVAAEMTGALANTKGSSIGFDVKEADFPKMMSILTGEQGNVFDLLQLGEAHAVGESSKTNADLNLDVLAQLRLLYHPQEDIPEVASVLRAGVGLVGNLNLAHFDQSQSTSRSAAGTSQGGATNAQLLRQGGVGVNLGPLNAVGLGMPGGPGHGAAVFALPEVSVMVKFDRGQSRGFSFSFKRPEPVAQSAIDSLVSDLSRYAPGFKGDLGALKLEGKPVAEQLATLQRFLETHPATATKPEAYHTLNDSLDKLVHQQNLVEKGLRQLTSVTASATYVGLRDDGQHAWLDDVAPANKADIVQWLKDDPQFAQVLDQLQNGEGTSVGIGMELKPDVVRAIERKILDGESPESLIKEALGKRENLRIKTMSLSYTASQSHAMSIPSMTNIGFSSNASLGHTHKRVNAELEYGADENKPLRMKLNDTLESPPPAELTLDLADQRVRTPRAPKVA